MWQATDACEQEEGKTGGEVFEDSKIENKPHCQGIAA